MKVNAFKEGVDLYVSQVKRTFVDSRKLTFLDICRQATSIRIKLYRRSQIYNNLFVRYRNYHLIIEPVNNEKSK